MDLQIPSEEACKSATGLQLSAQFLIQVGYVAKRRDTSHSLGNTAPTVCERPNDCADTCTIRASATYEPNTALLRFTVNHEPK